MRITTNTMNSTLLTSLNQSLEKQNNLQQELADGLAIHKPSDDPVKTVRSLGYSSNLAVNNQLTQNLKDARSWMTSTDSAMTDINSVMNKIKTLVVSADNTKSASDINTIGKQVDELINQVVSIGNRQVGNRYIFGGQSDSTQPFTREMIKDPNSDKTIDAIVYNGDNSKISMTINPGAVNPRQDSANLTGEDVFGAATSTYGQPTLSVFNHLMDIKNELEQKASVTQTNSSGGIGTVSGAYTGSGYANYDVRVDSVGQSGRVLGTSYSKDGGNTWIPVGSAGTGTAMDNAGNPAAITLPEGVKFNITDSAAKIAQSNALGGAATVTGNGAAQDYTVKIASVSVPAGQVTSAQYSNDGGITYQAFTAPANITDPNNTAFTLPNGSILNIAANSKNAINDTYQAQPGNRVGNVYSFRVPQAAFTAAQSNSGGGSAIITGAYTGNKSISYTVRATGTNGNGQVIGAEYSTDGGSSWSAISNYKVSQSNSNAGAATIAGTATNNYTVRVDGVDVNGKITSAAYSRDGMAWTPANIRYNVNNDSSTSTVIDTGTGGNTMTIASNAYNKVGDTYASTYVKTPLVDISNPSATALTLPNGLILNVKASAGNAANDTYSFQLPQGSGPDVSWLSGEATKIVDADQRLQVNAVTQLGARMAMYDMAANMMQDQNAVIQTDASNNSGIDEPKTITDFNTAQTVYKYALAVGAKIMQTSLVDFMK